MRTSSLLSERRGRRPVTETDARVALLFPGQGSQRDGLRELVAEHRPDLLELATELTGDDPFEQIEDGTRFQQPAIYSASLACWTAAGRPRADLLAGHSLGELAALVAGGALDELDGLRLAVTRGRLMQEAADRGPRVEWSRCSATTGRRAVSPPASTWRWPTPMHPGRRSSPDRSPVSPTRSPLPGSRGCDPFASRSTAPFTPRR